MSCSIPDLKGCYPQAHPSKHCRHGRGRDLTCYAFFNSLFLLKKNNLRGLWSGFFPWMFSVWYHVSPPTGDRASQCQCVQEHEHHPVGPTIPSQCSMSSVSPLWQAHKDNNNKKTRTNHETGKQKTHNQTRAESLLQLKNRDKKLCSLASWNMIDKVLNVKLLPSVPQLQNGWPSVEEEETAV